MHRMLVSSATSCLGYHHYAQDAHLDSYILFGVPSLCTPRTSRQLHHVGGTIIMQTMLVSCSGQLHNASGTIIRPSLESLLDNEHSALSVIVTYTS